jgi:hypothetical protein
LLTSLAHSANGSFVRKPTLREIKTPPALAALGAFFVPEPLGACLVVAAAVWWLCRKPFRRANPTDLPETQDSDACIDCFAGAVVIPTDTPPQ